jgi:hypothetical protein
MKTPVKRKRSPESLERREARLKAFANAYLVLMIKYGPEHGVTEAGKLMGVTKQAAYNWFKEPIVKEILKTKVEAALLKYLKSPDDVLSEAACIAFSDVGNYFEKDIEGLLKIKDLDKMGDNRRAIKSFKCDRQTKGEGEDKVVTEHIECEMWNKVDCLKALMMYHKLINAKQNDGGWDNNEPQVIVYLPDNGYGGGTPLKGIRFGQPKQIECEVVE